MNSESTGIFDNENFKQIEDIIDARKRLGQYNVYTSSKILNTKCVFSNVYSPSYNRNKTVQFKEGQFILNERESCSSEPREVKYTDSEITIVKVKCNREIFKEHLNKWDLNDIAVPGDGSHLGESPSLVNLVTLVAQNVQCEGDDEYLVPLSCWDPEGKVEDLQLDMRCSDLKISEKNSPTNPNTKGKRVNLFM